MPFYQDFGDGHKANSCRAVIFFTDDGTCMAPGCEEEADREAAPHLATQEPLVSLSMIVTPHKGAASLVRCVLHTSHTMTLGPSFGFNSNLLGIQVQGALKVLICTKFGSSEVGFTVTNQTFYIHTKTLPISDFDS